MCLAWGKLQVPFSLSLPHIDTEQAYWAIQQVIPLHYFHLREHSDTKTNRTQTPPSPTLFLSHPLSLPPSLAKLTNILTLTNPKQTAQGQAHVAAMSSNKKVNSGNHHTNSSYKWKGAETRNRSKNKQILDYKTQQQEEEEEEEAREKQRRKNCLT